MDNLDVDYMVLKEKGGELTDICKRLQDEIGKIAEYTANLDIFWDGDANSAFISRIGEDLVSAGALMIRIKETVRLIRKALLIYMENETDVQRMIGGYRK